MIRSRLSQSLTRRWPSRDLSTTSASVESLSIVLFTRPECSLCVPFAFLVKKLQFKYPQIIFNSVNLHDAPFWSHLYTNDIPVLHLNGREVARHRLTERQLVDAIESEMNSSPIDRSTTSSSLSQTQDKLN